MKKRLYFLIAAITVLTLATILSIVQSLLALQIKQEIKNWAKEYALEISDFRCGVNLLKGNIGFKNLTLKQEGNEFKIKRGHITFKLSELISNKNIKGIYVDKAEIKLEHFIPFSLPLASKGPIYIDEIEIKNTNLKITSSNGGGFSGINILASLKNMGTNKKTMFSINASSNSSFIEIKGDFDFNNWKKRLTYEVLGKNVHLETLNLLEKGFLPQQVKEQLLSLYFKDILMVNLIGKMDISGEGEINEENIDSKLKFSVSDLSCETENERIKSLIKRVNDEGRLEIDYKIYGTTSNPFLTYDINF